MAKHAKRRKTSGHRRRRRLSGMPKINVQSTALQIGGAILASKTSQFLSKDPTKTTLVNIAPFAGLALGIVAPMISKNAVVKDLANGMLIMGGIQVLKKLAPGLIGNFAMIPIVSGTTNQFRNMPKTVMNGVGKVGFPLPQTSVYKSDALSVISGFEGSGAGCAY